MNIEEQRAAFVQAAVAYIGTPYHHMGRVKGAGVDCATLLICSASDAKIISDVKLDYYPSDWNLHRGSERYLATISKYVKEMVPPPDRAPIPGDIVLWRFGRSYSHAAIVVEWPKVVHARMGTPVCFEDAEKAQWLTTIGESDPARGKPRPKKFFSLWGE